MGKGEIARNEQFLLFPQCFLRVLKTLCHFHHSWNCCLQTLWVWKSLYFVVWERVKLIHYAYFLVRVKAYLKESSPFCRVSKNVKFYTQACFNSSPSSKILDLKLRYQMWIKNHFVLWKCRKRGKGENAGYLLEFQLLPFILFPVARITKKQLMSGKCSPENARKHQKKYNKIQTKWRARSLMFNPFQNKPCFPPVQVFWKHCVKWRNCSSRIISPFPTVFSPYLENFEPFHQIWNCHLQSLSVW